MSTTNQLSIFVADNNPMRLAIYRQLMKNNGFTNVSLFGNSEDCIERLDGAPNVVFLDHDITPADGLETLSQIKKHNPNILVVYMAYYAELHIVVKALDNGAFDYVIKGGEESEKVASILHNISSIFALTTKRKN